MTIDERFNLRGKVAAVIGGAGYLCSALARAMLEAQMKVIALDIAQPPTSAPALTGYLPCDVTSKEDLTRCREAVLKAHGWVDVLRQSLREVLLSQLAGILQSPLRNLAVVLQGPIRSLVLLLNAVGKKKGVKGDVQGNG